MSQVLCWHYKTYTNDFNYYVKLFIAGFGNIYVKYGKYGIVECYCFGCLCISEEMQLIFFLMLVFLVLNMFCFLVEKFYVFFCQII